jgi:hypothetical protein
VNLLQIDARGEGLRYETLLVLGDGFLFLAFTILGKLELVPRVVEIL